MGYQMPNLLPLDYVLVLSTFPTALPHIGRSDMKDTVAQFQDGCRHIQKSHSSSDSESSDVLKGWT